MIRADALKLYIEHYLRVFPGGEGFNTPEYMGQERGYKLELWQHFKANIEPALKAEVEEDALVTFDKIARIFSVPLKYGWNKPQNLIGYRYLTFLEKLDNGAKSDFVEAIRALLSAAPLEIRSAQFYEKFTSIINFAEATKPIAAQSAAISTFFLSLSDPSQYPFIKTRETHRSLRELTGEGLRRGYECIPQAATFFRELFDSLQQFGLKPNDLIDVQSFIWVVHSKGYDADSVKVTVTEGDKMPKRHADLPVSAPLNQILFGPPGTGKTFNTAAVAVVICDGDAPVERFELMKRYEELRREGRISFVTFHQSYGYEDFVEGLRPESREGHIHYTVRRGIFREACDAAKLKDLVKPNPLVSQEASSERKNHVLIIDEINRANISKVFGELITLIEEDKREDAVNAISLKLPYSGDLFCVPSNLYVVGTMNTADRSIALLDTALRRRFDFVELRPDYSVLPKDPIDGIDLRRLLKAINDRIEFLYDRDHTIGHAYLLKVRSLNDLEHVFRRKIIPLLQEYFYEDLSKVRLVLEDHEGSFVAADEGVPHGLRMNTEMTEVRTRYRIPDTPFPIEAYLAIYQ